MTVKRSSSTGGVEPHVVAAVADGGGGRGGEGAQVGGAVDAQVGGERARRPVVGEVGEQAVGAGVGELHAGGPDAVGTLGGVEVLEAGEVAAGEDQVHALLVLDVEVADGVPVLPDDVEAQRLGTAAPQLGLLDDDAQLVVGDAEAAHGVGLGGGHVPALLLGDGGGAARLDRARRRPRPRRTPRRAGR